MEKGRKGEREKRRREKAKKQNARRDKNLLTVGFNKKKKK
jgi:hypothetical protein